MSRAQVRRFQRGAEFFFSGLVLSPSSPSVSGAAQIRVRGFDLPEVVSVRLIVLLDDQLDDGADEEGDCGREGLVELSLHPTDADRQTVEIETTGQKNVAAAQAQRIVPSFGSRTLPGEGFPGLITGVLIVRPLP